MFPVLWVASKLDMWRLDALHCPKEVPWELVNGHRLQCIKNHGKTPEALANLRGLSPRELLAVITDRALEAVALLPIADVVSELRRLAYFNG
jgi:hypothetical protein